VSLSVFIWQCLWGLLALVMAVVVPRAHHVERGPGVTWRCCCRDAWQSLQTSRDPAVLCELVGCLPSLVSCLGPAVTGAELLPALAALLHNHLTWISSRLVRVMAPLLEVLPASGRDMVLKVGGWLPVGGTWCSRWVAGCLGCLQDRLGTADRVAVQQGAVQQGAVQGEASWWI
jgi:hypothetical protein